MLSNYITSNRVLSVLALMTTLGYFPNASANVFGFAAAVQVDAWQIPQGYQGFNWLGDYGTDSWVNNSNDYIKGTFGASDMNATLGSAWSNGATDLTMALATPSTFSLYSIDIATKWAPPTQFTLTGLDNSGVVYTFDATVTDVYQTFNLGWSGITELHISDGNNATLFITNIDVTIVPEPEVITMFTIGLISIAAARRNSKAS